ncbi:MAG: aminoacyl-histidine dipeptidase, partial [Bacteroidota bacterium]
MQALDLILERFDQISAVPRGTKQEARIREWLQGWARDHGFTSRTDAVGNLVIQIPASPGYEDRAPVVLQGHMDMVWQKTSDSDHDFTRDPIRVIRDGEWLKADRTTLGADNGIAIAIMLALAEEPAGPHPPLEFLLTVEEEVGGTGCYEIDPGIISGKILVNLDSEEDGVFTVGCAGSCTLFIHLPAAWEAADAGSEFIYLRVEGLQGGHSGGDIHKHRANANKLIGRALAHVRAEAPIRLSALRGGTVRNAIPRDAESIFAIPGGTGTMCRESLRAFEQALMDEYASTEHGLRLRVEGAKPPGTVLTEQDTDRVIRLLRALPNGVHEMSTEMEGYVETSNNVGIIELRQDGFHVTSSQRSAVASRLEEIISRVEAIAQLAGAGTRRNRVTLPWRPRWDSPLLKKSVEVYQRQFGKEPLVEMTHGGLECGVLSTRCGGLDAISLGPTILDAHSPDERLHVPSVERTWR